MVDREKPARKSSVSDYKELQDKIEKALSSNRYKARTLSGIAKSAHADTDEIVKAIKDDRNLREIVKVYPRRTKDGKLLLTTKDRFYKEAGFSDKFVDLFATKRWDLDDV